MLEAKTTHNIYNSKYLTVLFVSKIIELDQLVNQDPFIKHSRTISETSTNILFKKKKKNRAFIIYLYE